MPGSTQSTASSEHPLRYACVPLLGGCAAVVMSERGVVDVCFAGSDVDLVRELRVRFREAALAPDAGLRRAWVDAVVRRFHQQASGDSAGFPLDLKGTSVARSA